MAEDKKEFEVSELDKLFQEAEDASKEDFAKMRTSLLLIAGQHYNKRGHKGWERIRTSRDLSNETKLRLTKNHIGKITRRYSNIIMSTAPGVTIKAKHEREMQDQKSAELNQSVWSDGKERNDWQTLLGEWADDFVGIGEVWTKLLYDQNVGEIIGHEPQLDEFGMPMVDEMGQPVQGTPIRAGEIKFEEVYGFNILGAPECKNIKKSPWHCVKKMRPVKLLKQMFPKDADKLDETKDEEFQVFESNEYRASKKGEMLVREWFWKPTPDMPDGYYVIQVAGHKLEEGPLPGGIYPLIGERFEYIQTKARGVACTDPLRPYQAEVNRTASKIAEHQITLGDDKLVLLNGSKMSAGVQLPGIRGITVSGQPPTILQGRNGAQYADYMLQQIKEMYAIAEIEEEPTDIGNLQPHTLLYRAASKKLRFSRYVSRFEGFLRTVCSTYLKLAKLYYPEQTVIMAVGRNEAINVTEFKNTKEQALQIVIEEQSEDIETKLGRAMRMDHIIQYVGPNMDATTLGKVLSELPYANLKDTFSDLTLDYESATNDILALDRGQEIEPNYYDNHEYAVKRLNARKKQADYKQLHEHIRNNYDKLIAAHMDFEKAKKEQLVRANSGFIPDGGTLIGVDYFVQDPNNPERTRRARIPYSAVDWLVKKLDDQGVFKAQMVGVPQEEIAQHQAAEAVTGIPQAGGSNAEIVPPALQSPMR